MTDLYFGKISTTKVLQIVNGLLISNKTSINKITLVLSGCLVDCIVIHSKKSLNNLTTKQNIKHWYFSLPQKWSGTDELFIACESYVKKNISVSMIYNQTHFCNFLTVVNTFPYTFSEKYFLLLVIPPIHLCMVIVVIIKRLRVVELWWNYGWNFM